ncbi:MAG: hypothetical protein ACRC3Y_04115 [Romboutsia sp.]|uniref:hypothetical protein n=1 Tax=Romboutsia sp. TaxID=1965302 RepID=UPI003F2E3FF0
MRGILKGSKLYLRNLLRTKIMLFLAIIPIYDFLVLKSCLDGLNYKLIGTRTYLIQGMLLGLIYLGFILAKQEEKDNCKEVLLSINKGKEYSIMSKLFVGIIVSIILTIYLICGQVVVTVIVGYPLEILHQIILGYIIYALIPMIIFYITGLMIGQYVKGYKSYGMIFVVWVMFTSLNHYILRLLESYIYIKLDILKWFFTMGVFEPSYPMYNGIEGYDIRSFTIAKLILILSLIILIFVISNFKKNKKIGAIILICIGIFVCSTIEIYDNRYNIKEKSMRGDFNEKSEDTSIREGVVTNNYEIKEYDIVMDSGNKSGFNVGMNIEIKKESDIINFTLDERAKINYIKDEKGNVLEFKQDGFLTSVNLGAKRNKGEKEKIIIDYYIYITGKETFANDSGMNLTQDYPYLPLETLGEVYSYKHGIGIEWSNLTKRAKYNVKIKNNSKKLYSNLDETAENEFSGYSNNGLYLLQSDEFIEENYNGVKYYYTRINKGDIQISECDRTLKEICKKYEDITGKKKEYKKVFLINLGNGGKGFDMEETLLLKESNKIYEDNIYSIMQRNLLYNQNYNKQVEYISVELLYPIIDFVHFDKKDVIENFKNEEMVYGIDEFFNVKKQKKFQESIIKILETEKVDKQKFVREFYKVLENGGGIKETEIFLNQYLKGENLWGH